MEGSFCWDMDGRDGRLLDEAFEERNRERAKDKGLKNGDLGGSGKWSVDGEGGVGGFIASGPFKRRGVGGGG
jgi:hypothetical protein